MARQNFVVNLNVVGPDGSAPRRFEVRRMVNAGYVGRDRAAVQAHIDELEREGVPPPPSVPMLIPIGPDALTTADSIDVIGERTSGEVEYALFLDGDEVLVGIGSDHTDREMERMDIVRSKQICRNVVSTDVWRYAGVASAWDELVMRSWAKPVGGDEVLYQEGALGKIISAEDLMELVKSRLVDGDARGLVIFSGTVAVLAKEMICGEAFRVELADPRSGRSLACRYDVRKLDYLR